MYNVKNSDTQQKGKNKVNVYIDGFNYYHSICLYKNNSYKWLDLKKLINNYVDKQREKLEEVFYFSAYPTHLSEEKQDRHKLFEQVQQQLGNIQFINGTFKRKLIECSHCNKKTKKYEEKQTDVSFGVQIISDVFQKDIQTILIVSNDGDFAPIIRKIKDIKPHINIRLIIPAPKSRSPVATELKEAMKHYYNLKNTEYQKLKITYIKESLLQDAILPDEIELEGVTYNKPKQYKNIYKNCY